MPNPCHVEQAWLDPSDAWCPLHKQVEPVDLSGFGSDDVDADVMLVTTHFNPASFRNRVKTYQRWLPYLGPLKRYLTAMEVLFDRQTQQLPGSHIFHATRSRNAMWQKEALINVALQECDREYFAWLDHDMIPRSRDWLARGIAALDEHVAVQLYSSADYLDEDDVVLYNKTCHLHNWRTRGRLVGFPGGAWIARTAFLKEIGGLSVANILGGGDQIFNALGTDQLQFLDQFNPEFASRERLWFKKAKAKLAGRTLGYVNQKMYHLYHGPIEGRQYRTRNDIYRSNRYDPEHDIRIGANGLLEWSSDKPRLHRQLIEFFNRRAEDD